MLGPGKKLPGGSAALIGGLGLLILGAIAFALPPAPIAASQGSGGYLIGHSQLSDQFAEQLAARRYAHVVVDVSTANLESDALWRDYVASIHKRRFPIWGWVDVSDGLDQAREALRSVSVSGFYVFGDNAVAAAAALRLVRQGLPIIPVLFPGDTPPPTGPYALAVDAEGFVGELDDRATPVLRAAGMSEVDVMAAREKRAGENYVVSALPLLR